MKNSLDSRLSKIEKMIDDLLHTPEDFILIVNKSTGQTPESVLAEKEKELGRRINKGKIIYFIISGLTKI